MFGRSLCTSSTSRVSSWRRATNQSIIGLELRLLVGKRRVRSLFSSFKSSNKIEGPCGQNHRPLHLFSFFHGTTRPCASATIVNPHCVKLTHRYRQQQLTIRSTPTSETIRRTLARRQIRKFEIRQSKQPKRLKNRLQPISHGRPIDRQLIKLILFNHKSHHPVIITPTVDCCALCGLGASFIDKIRRATVAIRQHSRPQSVCLCVFVCSF